MQDDSREDAKNEVLKMSMADLEKSALQHELVERAKATKYAKQAGAYQNLLSSALKTLKNKKKAQLRRVNAAAKAGVWSSYQASLHVREQQLKAQVDDVDRKLQQEELFRQKVRQHAAQLVEGAQRV